MSNKRYRKYLQSDWWKQRRNEIVEQRKVCEICGSSKNLEVHHLTYENIGHEKDEDLKLLCCKCHRKVHKGKLFILKDDEMTIPIDKFYKGNALEVAEITKEISPYAKAMLFTMCLFLGYEDCCLKYDNGKKVSAKNIITLAGMSEKKGYQVINELCEKKIIYKKKIGRKIEIYFNPWVCMRGIGVKPEIKKMFGDYEIRTMNNVKWKDLKE